MSGRAGWTRLAKESYADPRNLLLICSALAACAADPEPDRQDAWAAGGTGEPGDARIDDALNGDATVPGPDADLRPNCVVPVDGACPDDIEGISTGGVWQPEEGCWREEIISCLYNVGGATGSAEYCRESDGVPFGVGTITCIPFPHRQCTPEEWAATAPVLCPDE